MKLLALLLVAVAGAFADTITLKDGTVVEGSITGETEENLSIEMLVAKGIFFTEVISKTNVAQVVRLTPEQQRAATLQRDYTALGKYTLTPNTTLPVAQYDRVITGVFKKFLNEYPGSEYESQVQNRITQWEAEREKDVAGLIKVDGAWQSKADAEKMQRNAKIRELMQSGQQAFTARQWSQAARAYDSLLSLQPGSAAALGAQRQLHICLTEWRKQLELEQKTVAVDLAAAQHRYDQAQQTDQHSFTGLKKATDGTPEGKLGESGAAFMKSQTAVTTAKNQLTPLQARATAIQSQLAEISHRLNANDLQAASPTQNLVAASSPSPATTDVLDDTVNWWQRNWMMLAIVAVIGVYLLSRITGK